MTFLFIKTVLFEKWLLKIEEQTEITPIEDLGSLVYWGVPEVDLNSFVLTIDGAVEHQLSLSRQDLMVLPSFERQVRYGLRRRVSQQLNHGRCVGPTPAGSGRR